MAACGAAPWHGGMPRHLAARPSACAHSLASNTQLSSRPLAVRIPETLFSDPHLPAHTSPSVQAPAQSRKPLFPLTRASGRDGSARRCPITARWAPAAAPAWRRAALLGFPPGAPCHRIHWRLQQRIRHFQAAPAGAMRPAVHCRHRRQPRCGGPGQPGNALLFTPPTLVPILCPAGQPLR